MNMFRDLTMTVLIVLGLGLIFGEPEKWAWIDFGGSYSTTAFAFLINTRPFSELICFVLALTLFMTRLKY